MPKFEVNAVNEKYITEITPDKNGWYDFPETAILSLAPPPAKQGEWNLEKRARIKTCVEVDPPITAFTDHGSSRKPASVSNFPPAGAYFIMDSGGTFPRNLAQLVEDRIGAGWQATDELKRTLNIE